MTKSKIEKIKNKVLETIETKENFYSDKYDMDNYVELWLDEDTFEVRVTKYGMSAGFSESFKDFDKAFEFFLHQVDNYDFEVKLY